MGAILQRPNQRNKWPYDLLSRRGRARVEKVRSRPQYHELDLTIDSAQVVTPTTIRARTRNDDPNWGAQNGAIADVVIEIANNRMRSLNSITPDGTQLIKDGVFVKGGTAVPSFEKCSN